MHLHGGGILVTKDRQNRGWASNRRVVIVVTNVDEPRPEMQDANLQMDQEEKSQRTGKPAAMERIPAKKNNQSNRRESQQGRAR
jgi:hypothetical protein